MHQIFRLSRSGLAVPLLTVLAIAPLSARAPRQASSSTLPAARGIIDRHIKEIGGRDAVLAQNSVYATGTVSMPAAGLTGSVEAFHAKPNKFVQRVTLPGIGNLEEGFDGTVGWSLSPLTGPTLLDGKQLAQRAFEADFFQELKGEGRYQSMTTLEKGTFEGRPAYKIRLVRKDGAEDLEFYDVETGFKIGAISTRESPMGPMQETQVMSDYKKFGTLYHPATTKVTVMGTQMVMTIATVEYGKVDSSVFALPPPIKALVR